MMLRYALCLVAIALFYPLSAFAYISSTDEDIRTEDTAVKVKETVVIYADGDDPDYLDEIAPDPIESINRGFYDFNRSIDIVILEPIARSYRAVVPEWGRQRIGNALSNINEPVNFLNTILQGNVDDAFVVFWRFVINSTIGIGGINDVATDAGLPRVQEDFGQTLAVYGVGNGPYIVLPFLGPSTIRDTVGFVANTASNPFNYLGGASIAITATDVVHTRETLLDITDEIERTSFDPYSTVRSAYIQRREKAIKE